MSSRIFRKPVFFLDKLWEALRTSPQAQAITCLAVILAIIGACVYGSYERQRLETLRSEQEARSAAETRQQDKASFLKRNFNFSATGDPTRTIVLGIGIPAGIDSSSREALDTQLRSSLSDMYPDMAFASGVLLPPFFADGYFSKVFQGAAVPLQDSDFFAHAGELLLIQPKIWFQDSAAGNGMKACSVYLVCRMFPSLDKPMREKILYLTGIGSTEERSLKSALEDLATHKEELEKILK